MFSEHCLFTHAVLNPPYKKIQSTSRARLLLRSLGIETSNLYTAFLELAARSLEDKGQLVAITPRSFCNGIYFREFRRQFTAAMRFDKVHLFNSRSAAFQEDNVLQENVIFHATRGGTTNSVTITTGDGPSDGEATVRRVPFDQFIYPGDPEMFIHLTANDHGTEIAQRILSLKSTLADINIAVSTGRVVEFRSRERLRETATDDTVPLIYPRHFSNGGIRWPHPTSARPNAIIDTPEVRDQFVCGGPYVLVKRFTSKEERRRVVAVVYNVESTNSQMVAFENHINFFHRDGCQLPKHIALGLAAYLNSTLVDTYFRQFSGSTQVNATDLRNLPYPTITQLEKLGRLIEKTPRVQEELDVHLEHLIFANP
jgi:adenine-specific DNA-methyltransferase